MNKGKAYYEIIVDGWQSLDPEFPLCVFSEMPKLEEGGNAHARPYSHDGVMNEDYLAVLVLVRKTDRHHADMRTVGIIRARLLGHPNVSAWIKATGYEVAWPERMRRAS